MRIPPSSNIMDYRQYLRTKRKPFEGGKDVLPLRHTHDDATLQHNNNETETKNEAEDSNLEPSENPSSDDTYLHDVNTMTSPVETEVSMDSMTSVDDVDTMTSVDIDGEDVPTVMITEQEAEDAGLFRQNSLGSRLARRRCVVRLDGHRYTIGW